MTTPTPVKVYGPPISTAVSRVLVCLLEKEVPFQVINMDMLNKREHKSPEFLKLQPFGQVPAFQDGNLTLWPVCSNLLEKASIEQWLEAEAQNFNAPSLTLMFQLAYAPRVNIPQDEGLIKQNKEKLAKVLDVYEKRLGERRFLAGDHFTLADLSHLPNSQYLVTNADEINDFFTSRENVGRWFQEISSRESWKKVLELQKSPPPS